MRVAHFIQRYPPALGGSEAYFARLSRYCAAQGDAVTVFTSSALDLEAFWTCRAACAAPGVEEDDGVTIRRYALWRWPGRRYVLKALSLFPERHWQCLTLPCNPICPDMWRDASRGADLDFEVVHASAFPYAWPIACARRLARRLDIPLLVTPFLHLGDPSDATDRTRRGYTAPPLRWLLGEADAVFVQTPTEREAALHLGIAPQRVHLQGLGVEPAECTGGDRSGARQRWGIGADGVVVGHLANQSWEKGTNDLLQALEPLWRAKAPLHLVLAGPQMPNFQRFWKSFVESATPEVRARVHQLGVLSAAEKKDFFAGIDLFALPSRSDSFGLVLLEAWANRVPNIAYAAGGVTDVIEHKRDGLLVKCGDIQALTQALRDLCGSASDRTRLGRTGQSRLAHEFCWPDKLELVREVSRGLTEKKDRTDPATRTLPTS
jgi:glycosyltransferase involved in cell wall biosynthesis